MDNNGQITNAIMLIVSTIYNLMLKLFLINISNKTAIYSKIITASFLYYT